MAQNPSQPQQAPQTPVIDPDNVQETLCDGQFNLARTGNLATLTFTHVRPDPAQMFATGAFVPTAIVRARIVLSVKNLIALRDFLNTNVQSVDTTTVSSPATGGTTKH